jgi:DNA-binding IclR family transcriptional regulator
MARLLSCLRGPPATVRALAHAAGCETQQVHRFLNALYLQSALMVTRSCSAN